MRSCRAAFPRTRATTTARSRATILKIHLSLDGYAARQKDRPRPARSIRSKSRMHVLIVEDNPVLGRGLETALDAGRTRPSGLATVMRPRARARDAFDLVLLDLGLPRLNGLDVLREMRRRGVQMPVIVITARDDIGDRVGGLDAGADDYLVKPFHLDELAARLRALHRRAQGLAHRLIEVGLAAPGYDGDRRRTIAKTGRSLAHGVRCAARARRARRPSGHARGTGAGDVRIGGVESNALEVHIHALRRKLAPKAIRTVRGLGYLLVRDGGSDASLNARISLLVLAALIALVLIPFGILELSEDHGRGRRAQRRAPCAECAHDRLACARYRHRHGAKSSIRPNEVENWQRPRGDPGLTVHGHKYEMQIGFQYWAADNRLHLTSHNLRDLALDAAPAGFADIAIGGTPLARIHAARLGSRLGARRRALRQPPRDRRALALENAAPLLIGVPLLAISGRSGRAAGPQDPCANSPSVSPRVVPIEAGPIGFAGIPLEVEPWSCRSTYCCGVCARCWNTSASSLPMRRTNCARRWRARRADRQRDGRPPIPRMPVARWATRDTASIA